MASQGEIIDRSNAYIARSEIQSLLRVHRPRSTRGRSSSGSSSNGPAVVPSPAVHSLILSGAVFVDPCPGAVSEVQQLLRSLPQLSLLNAARSNVTGRIFYRGGTFRVHDPEKEHVSVEGVQAAAASTTSTTSGSTVDPSPPQSIVRDDNPPMILAVRADQDYNDGEDDDEDDADDALDASEEGASGGSSGTDSDTHSDSDDAREGVTSARRRRRRRRRHLAQPEIVDLNQTSLADLLSRHSAATTGTTSLSLHATNTTTTNGLTHPRTHNYYFYVRTFFSEEEGAFERYYVRLNWMPHLRVVDMSSTSISGYGVVSLLASCCSSLQSLFLTDCLNIDNTGVHAIVTLCTSLRQLSLAGCPKIDRFGLMYLAEMSEHVVRDCLQLIDVSHCGGNDTRVQPKQQQQQQQVGGGNGTSGQLLSLALFNALEERGFRGQFVWQHTPKREVLLGDPQFVSVATPMPLAASIPADLFAPLPPTLVATNNNHAAATRVQMQIASPFSQHYSLEPNRIIDLALYDITAQVVTEIPWSWIRARDAARMERLARHHIQLGVASSSSSSSSSSSIVAPSSFVSSMEEEMARRERERFMRLGQLIPSDHPPTPEPRFYALNLSGQLVHDRLLHYILLNWGDRLYSLALDGTYLTSSGLRELARCPHLHILSLTSCLNLADKTRANANLKEAVSAMPYLAELNVAHSRLSGRMMSSHPNLKLDVLIANGCPISAYAMRMLASASVAAPAQAHIGSGGVSSSSSVQSMCKYSLRLLSLSNCAFVNRRCLGYLLHFSYLTLIDVSECRALQREDVVEEFVRAAEQDVKFLESLVQGRRKSASPASIASSTSFATMLCHLRHLVCFGIGAPFSERRAAEFARDLNARAMRLQQLLILHHQQVSLQSNAEQQHHQHHNNLAPPSMTGPALMPAYLRRDFNKEPIVVVAQRQSPLLHRYQPTLTRFLAPHQEQTPTGSSAPTVIAVPPGLEIGAHGSGSAGGEVAVPPAALFRGSSVLDDCPYSFLPAVVPPTPTPTVFSPGASTNTTSTAGTTSPSGPPRSGSKADLTAAGIGTNGSSTAAPVRGTQAFFQNALHSSPHAASGAHIAHPMPLHHSNSYMTMLSEHVSGGVQMTPASINTIGPGGVPTHTWQSFPPTTMSTGGGPGAPASLAHSVSAPLGELYSIMPVDHLAPVPHQQRANHGIGGVAAAATATTNANAAVASAAHLSVEGRATVNLTPSASPGCAVSPIPGFSNLALTPNPMMPLPYAEVPMPSASSAPPVASSTVSLPLPPQAHAMSSSGVSSLAKTAPASLASGSAGIPATSFWSTLGSGSGPAPTPIPAAAPVPATPAPVAHPVATPAGFVSPFAALQTRPPAHSVSSGGSSATPFPTPFPNSAEGQPAGARTAPPSASSTPVPLPAASLPLPPHLP